MATDFTMKPMVDPTAIARLAQEQAEKQAQLDQQNKQNQANNILAAAKAASDMVSASVEASKQRQKRDAIKTLGNSLAAQVPNLPYPGGIPLAPDANGNIPSSIPDYNTQNQIRSSVTLNPDSWTKELANQVLQSPLERQKTALDFARTQALAGKVTPATQTLINQMHEKIGKPAPDTSMMTEEQAQTYLGHAAKLLPQSSVTSPLAEIRKQNLIANLNDKMSKKMNPANWQPSTMAGKSAALVANADSAINLANQMLNGEIPITEQNMTSLALDANRVLSQTGVVSEKTTQELKAKTGYGDFAQGLQYFSSHPQDKKFHPFVKILQTEIQRQRDQRQAIVDRTLSGELSSLNQLKRLSPEDWEAQILANGFDLEAAKKGKLKINPEFGSTMYGWDIGKSNKSFGQQPGGLNVDQDALAAELKRRGL